jgi:hypothetical protein
MTWLRDALFIGLIGGGVAALAANLVPPREAKHLTNYDSSKYHDTEFTVAVAKVDDSFHQSWADEKLRPAAPASNLLAARRVALGLMGTVPSLEEVRQLEALPPADRLPWWLDHVLDDRRFADYFAERLARAFVGTENGPFVFFRRNRFVTWLSDQVAANRPYDAIVRELIAGEGVWTDKPATNFVSVTAQQEKKNQPDPVRLAGRVTRGFLGLRLDCAQCHDHPFAKWTQADFEGLSAFFGQTEIGFTGIGDGHGEYVVEERRSKEKRTVEPAVPFAKELVPAGGTRRQQLAAWVTHPQNPYFARAAVNRVWAIVFGRPPVDPVDNLENGATPPPALQLLADDFAAHGYDLRRLIRLMVNTEVFRLDSAAENAGEKEEKAWSVFPLTRLRPEQVVGSVLQASQLETVDAESHILVRLVKFGQTNDFVKRYGDSGEDEFEGRGGTIPQRLLLMNGKVVRERAEATPFNASARIAWLAREDARAVEVAYLAALTRRPTPAEAAHFEQALADKSLTRGQRVEDLFWALLNSTEFSWNH